MCPDSAGTMSLVARSIIPRWFERQRGRATAVMGLGYVASQTLAPLVNSYVIRAHGWRTCWILWGILLAGIYVPISQWLCVNSPSEVSSAMQNSRLKIGLLAYCLLSILSSFHLFSFSFPTFLTPSFEPLLWLALIRYFLMRCFLPQRMQVGLVIDGDLQVQMLPVSSFLPAPTRRHNYTLKQALRKPAFWILLWCAFQPAAVNTAIIFHLSSIIK